MSSDDKTVMFTGTVEVPARPVSAAAGPLPCKLICLEPSRLPDPAGLGLEIDLSGKEQTVGRGEENTVPLNATGISKKHARFYFSSGSWRVQDMGSTNGVHVNDAKVEDAPLKAGDTIKIGKIPFQFVMVRPDIKGTVTKDGKKHDEDFDPDKTVSERTMFVGSNLMAAAMLLDAKNKQQEAEKRAAAAPVRGGAGRKAAMTPAVEQKKVGIIKWVAAAVLLIVIIGGYWFLGRGSSGVEGVLKNSRAEVKAFMRDSEDSAGRYTAAEHQQQTTQLGNMMAELSEATSQYPDSEELKAVEAEVLFLQFERNLLNLIQQGKPDQAIPLLAQVQSEFGKLSTGSTATKDEDSRKIYTDVANLLELAGPVIQIKTFARRYPNPAKDAKVAPSKAEMEQIKKMRDQFSELRKKNNLALSLNYLLFNSIVGDVDDKDAVVVDKWGAMTGTN
ncbi:MAG TPA: FHA domain-containing protein [Gammaproteobacteria bacterium]|nr:FHA domain-containing protein [Gammaproteobacteria bacterium]